MNGQLRRYVTYDEIEDVLASTDLLRLITPRLGTEPALWKWVIVAAQNALQGALVCALDDGVGASVLTDRSAQAWLGWLRSDRQTPCPKNLRLADFWALFRKYCCQNSTAKQRVTKRQVRDIHKLHRHFRNGFEHFQPQSWSIEKAGLPRIINTAVEFIEIAMRGQTVANRMDECQLARLENNLAEARAALTDRPPAGGHPPSKD
jgi:hypothetical protein